MSVAVATEKELILQTIHDLPDENCIEEAMERLYLLFKVAKGVKQANAGQTISNEDAKERMKKWLE
ncbi:MAG TPA: hypothetical protein DCM38_07385 [Gammaproteobacteria bacterium]|nr:hypothetical protein [Gammaproteobacteria bacterium]